jgi:hypothetical protein
VLYLTRLFVAREQIEPSPRAALAVPRREGRGA